LADHRNIDNLLKYTFYFENGIVAFLNYLIRDHETKAVHKNIFYVNDTYENIQVEIALSYVDEIETSELAFANNIHTPEGGMHLTGFRSALTRVLNDYLKKTYSKENLSLTGEDVREGLMVIVSVKIREPQFEGQTKAKLGNPEARVAVDQIMSKAFRDFLEKNPEDVKRILEKCLVSAKARSAAKLARENVLRKSVMEHTTLPGKLADCISRKAENSELFIVEGDSAGGCFSGDTEIALTDGRNVSFEDLVKEYGKGIKNYCYTILKNGNVGVAEIKNPRITNHNTKVVRVTLDNGEEIICTPDHKFMLKNGEYKEAKDLVNTDSLMVKDNILKVKSIQMIDALMDVYDLEVENTHNFALASGVFVHNSAKQGRDRHTQAILPLRGKILNVEKARLDKMMSSEEIKAIILALGTSISEDFNLEKLRYHKIILMSDADVDGAHIRTLLLTLFYRYFLSIIEKGYLYAAQPPLFRVQKGKSFKYAYTEDEKEKIIDEMIKLKDDKKDTKSKKEQELEAESSEEAAGENDEAVEEVSKYKGIIVQRYKGLGEMNPEQL
jgi:DNA gyrase subunit B